LSADSGGFHEKEKIMSRCASALQLASCIAVSLATALALAAGAPAQTATPTPDFSSGRTAWRALNGADYIAVPGSPSPITNDPAHPHRGNNEGGQPAYRISDTTNSNLKQWAKEVMNKDNQEVLAGKIAYTPGSSCEPPGVPTFLQEGGLHYFVQTPKEVVMILEADAQVRRIYLDVPHTPDVKPSWHGESVGRYEGDTLVVDTIGLNTKTFIDHYRTPHSEKLHVIERFRMTDGGNTLEAHITIDDPDTFHEPWQAIRRWRREQTTLQEYICAENNLHLFDYGMPMADKPDF
jgi:hypothetical protein